MPDPLVIAHRGASGYRPEHTRSAYELAIAMGADAVEPDVVVSHDGVLVVRHENEIGGTTDVADRPEFAARRRTASLDGERVTGWFTEDFTWPELAQLRCRERLPGLRAGSAAFDDTEPMLSLRELLDLVRAGSAASGRTVGVVLEIKHATHFGGLGFDVAALVEAELREAGWWDAAAPLVIESFEPTVLEQLRTRGAPAPRVLLMEAQGAPFDLVAARGRAATGYRDLLTEDGLGRLAASVDGISVDKRIILGVHRPPARSVVGAAHARGLRVYTWTCRPENAFLAARFRGPGGPAAFGHYRREWAQVRAAGVDGVFADHPDLAVACFREGAAQSPRTL